LRQVRVIAVASLIWACVGLTGAELGQAAPSPATPAASPSPKSTAPADPCGSILSIVNRPAVTTGVCTVRTGHFDLENGYTNTTTEGSGAGITVNYPQSLLRIGTADPHLDFELQPPSHETSSQGGTIVTGASDISMGTKYELGYDSKAVWGLYGAIAFPTGISGFSAGNAQFTGDFNWGYTINSEFSLATTLSFNALSALNSASVAQSYFAFIPSAELSAALPGGPSQISAEYAYYSAAGPGLRSKSLIDFIYQRDFGSRLQFDTEYGLSPTPVNGQTEHYVGAGLSFMN
jgi:hypothetical protein